MGHVDGDDIAPSFGNRHVDESTIGLVSTPGVFHDVVGTLVLVACQADDGHGVSTALPADGMTVAQGMVDMSAQGVKGNVQQSVVFPVVGNGDVYLFVIGRIGEAGQGDVFVRSTYGMCKLQRRVSGPQHKDVVGSLFLVGSIVWQYVVTDDAITLYDVQQGLSHGTLC